MVLKFNDSQPVLVKEFKTHGILIFTRMRNNIKTKLKNKGRILVRCKLVYLYIYLKKTFMCYSCDSSRMMTFVRRFYGRVKGALT
jgi:hypothetical protein